jgi:hypothetical protein
MSDVQVATEEQREATPLPRLQLFISCLIQFAEPIAGLVIYPFINQFVRETGVTEGDETKTGYYAGVIEDILSVHCFKSTCFRSRLTSWRNAWPLYSGDTYLTRLAVDLSFYLDHWVCLYLCYCLGYRKRSGLLSFFVACRVVSMETLVRQFDLPTQN